MKKNCHNCYYHSFRHVQGQGIKSVCVHAFSPRFEIEAKTPPCHLHDFLDIKEREHNIVMVSSFLIVSFMVGMIVGVACFTNQF